LFVTQSYGDGKREPSATRAFTAPFGVMSFGCGSVSANNRQPTNQPTNHHRHQIFIYGLDRFEGVLQHRMEWNGKSASSFEIIFSQHKMKNNSMHKNDCLEHGNGIVIIIIIIKPTAWSQLKWK
jgi:hypothetical protein